MRLSDFDYFLPSELIAQHPAEPRHSSRLLVLDRKTGRMEHRRFWDIVDYLGCGDILVLNTTKVIPARLLGNKRGSGIRAEIFLLKPQDQGLWSCLVWPGRRLKTGSIVDLEHGLSAEIVGRQDISRRLVVFKHQGRDLGAAELVPLLEKVGHVPLPPYINRPDEDSDRARYQTVYAQEPGSVAAPTAGLHFTPELLCSLESRGIRMNRIVLHVGWGTFKSVAIEDIRRHRMDEEYYRIDEETARELSQAKAQGRRIVAVGTTSVRALESLARHQRTEGWTDIFIHPPYRFEMVDALITNFHLPRSTLLMLVSAFAGLDLIKQAYAVAIEKRYRFYSFGDAMLIV